MNITPEQRSLLAKYGIAVQNNINDTLCDLDDKITEIGFDANYELNATGLTLQKLYDSIFTSNTPTVHCPIIDGQADGTTCLEICLVADREINPRILPEGVVWNEQQRQKCLACRYHGDIE